MGFLADLKARVDAIEASHGGKGKNTKQGLLLMPISNQAVQLKEVAGGGLMSPREGYKPGSLVNEKPISDDMKAQIHGAIARMNFTNTMEAEQGEAELRALLKNPKNKAYIDGIFEDVKSRDLQETRDRNQEGGEIEMAPELMEQDVPVDTYPNMTPEEEAMPVASDEQMQEDYVDYVAAEVLTPAEQDYLNIALDNDPELEGILDKVITYATEFTGEGEVEGPGTGISDSIPARLSDGEFVFTKKATDQIGADNLQTMMDDAERAADGGLMQRYVLGGAVDDKELGGAVKNVVGDNPIMDDKTSMYGVGRQQEELRKQMMYANRMPSIIGR